MPLFDPAIFSISAGTTAATGPGVVFANSNGISFGISGNTVTASVIVTATASAGIGAVSAGTQSATSGTIRFANANGVTFGMAGSSVITASVNAGTGANTPVTVFKQGDFNTNYLISNGRIFYQPVSLPMPISASSGLLVVNISGHSNSSGALTMNIGVYTMSGQTASLSLSTIGTISWTSGSATNNSTQYGGISGTRYRNFPFASSLTPGDYLFGFAFLTQNDGTIHVFGKYGANIVGSYAGADTAYFIEGLSLLSTNAFPPSIIGTDSNYLRTGLAAMQQPSFILLGTT